MQAAPDSAPGTSSAATALVCDGVAVRFPRGSAWRPAGATWSAPAGSKTLLLGPSGSGKSTLALAIAGLVPEVLPANVRGDVRIDGHSLDDLSQARLRESVSIVFQDPDAQLFTETVFDEVCFALENRLLPVAEIERRAELAIEAMRLREHRDANPRHLSGGERQRVAIACALAASPRVLVLDEPTANLDPVSRAELYRTLEAMPDSSSRTVVVIEHNVDDALGFVDRVVALDARGTLLAAGPLRDVFTEHAAALADAGVWLPTGVRVRAALAGSPFASRLPAGPPLGAHELAAVFAGLHETGFAPRATAVPDARETVDGVAPDARAVRGAGAVPDADEPRGRDAVPDARGGDDRSLPGGASGAVGQAGRARAEPAVEARGLVVVRGRRTTTRPALRGVDLEVALGSFTAIVGVNGAGKSTLLHALAGLVRPAAGEVRVAGRRVRHRGPAPIGLVFQNPEHQFVESSVQEELRSSADPALTSGERDARVEALLARFALASAADRHPSMLSGGQQRRLSVGTALMGGHRIIAFDEPTFGQDADGAAALAELLADLYADGVTVLVVTHDLQLVADRATDVVVLRDGEVVAAGSADEVLAGDAVAEAGLRLPPLCAAVRTLPESSSLRAIRRLRDLDGLTVGTRPVTAATTVASAAPTQAQPSPAPALGGAA